MAKTFINDNLKSLMTAKNATETSVDLYIYGDIVSSWWGAWDKEDKYPGAIKDFIKDADGKDINVHINSNGGSVFAGIAIYNMLKNYDGNVTVYIDGVAASIASVIAMAGDRIVMRTGSAIMVHSPMICLYGGYNAAEMREMATQLDEIQKCIIQVYDSKKLPSATTEVIEEIVNAETWLTSETAKTYFDIEEESVAAVATESEFMFKFLDMPEKMKNTRNEKALEAAKAELELLNLYRPPQYAQGETL